MNFEENYKQKFERLKKIADEQATNIVNLMLIR